MGACVRPSWQYLLHFACAFVFAAVSAAGSPKSTTGKVRTDEEGVIHSQASYKPGELIGMAIVFVPLALWSMFCMSQCVDWAKNGREKSAKRSWMEDRAR